MNNDLFDGNQNNDSIWESAMEKIRRDKKCKPTCCIGPVGPAGPSGPATISIGTTTTGAPGTDASVTNTGTSENVILDFVIPEGEVGPAGPAGIVPTISSILVDNDGTQTITANSLINLGTEINSTGDAITYAVPTVTLNENGSYYILYSCLVSNTAASGDVGASLLVNGAIVDNASEYIPATSMQTQILLQHSLTITAPTTVQVSNRSTVSNDYHDSSLSIIKLG